MLTRREMPARRKILFGQEGFEAVEELTQFGIRLVGREQPPQRNAEVVRRCLEPSPDVRKRQFPGTTEPSPLLVRPASLKLLPGRGQLTGVLGVQPAPQVGNRERGETGKDRERGQSRWFDKIAW